MAIMKTLTIFTRGRALDVEDDRYEDDQSSVGLHGNGTNMITNIAMMKNGDGHHQRVLWQL